MLTPREYERLKPQIIEFERIYKVKGISKCPFCGKVPDFEPVDENYGTVYEYHCDCGLSHVSVQICDLMTREEKRTDKFIDTQYDLPYRKRARDEAIKLWNTRTELI